MKPVNLLDYAIRASERLDAAALAHFDGGAADEHTLRENPDLAHEIENRIRESLDIALLPALGSSLPDAP